MPLTKEEVRAIVDQVVRELFTRPIKADDGGLGNDPHLDSENQVRMPRFIVPVAFINAANGQIVGITTTSTSPARANSICLKTVDVNVEDRYMGELLLEDDLIDVSGGAAVAGAAFNTRGYNALFVTILNPTWVTNPGALTVSGQVSTDDFDTEAFDIMALDGVIIAQTLTVADADYRAFFMPVQSNAGALAATNTPGSLPIPDIDGMTMRLLFTPVGGGITNETITVNVYGITSR